MKKLMPIMALLLLIVPISKAQYSLLTKGQLCPFDTAVAIHIDTYRLETRKLNLADSLILNMQQQLIINNQSILTLQNRLDINNELITVYKQQITDKNNIIDLLNTNYYQKPKETWWTKNKRFVYFIGGLISGGVGIYYIK